MDKETIKSLLKELFQSGEIEIESVYDKSMDKAYIEVKIDNELVYSENPYKSR